MITATVTVKGQVVVPATIRRKYGIKKGTRVAFIEREGEVIFRPLDVAYLKSLKGIFGTHGKVLKTLMEDRKRERDL